MGHPVPHLAGSANQTDFSLKEVWNWEVAAPRFSGKPQKNLLGMYKQWILWEKQLHQKWTTCSPWKRVKNSTWGISLRLHVFSFTLDWLWQERNTMVNGSLPQGGGKCSKNLFCPITFPFSKVYHGLFSWWTLLRSPKESGSVPPGVPSEWAFKRNCLLINIR